MNKRLTITLISFLCIGAIVLGIAAIVDKKSTKQDEPDANADEVLTAQYTDIVPKIDGEIDDVWDNTMAIYANASQEAAMEDFASGYAKVLWTEDTLYLLADITDPTVDVGEDNTANQACFWVSETASTNGEYGLGDWNISINQAGVYEYYSGENLSQKAEYTAKLTKTGYVVEVAIPIQTEDYKYTSGSKIGFDLSVEDDSNADNERDAICATTVLEYWSCPYALTELELVD